MARQACPHRRLTTAAAATLEAVEPRLLFAAAAPNVGISGGVLYVVPDARFAAAVVVEVDANDPTMFRVTVDQVDRGAFARSAVSGIAVHTGIRTDSITLTDDVDVPATLDGSWGHDTIYGGAADDQIEGDRGRDLIFGRGGDDVIVGGKKSDTIYGGDGADTINGKEGDDRVYGNRGDDSLRGWGGSDVLFGGNGDDQCVGDGGYDTLGGGRGDDVLDGGNDADRVFGGAGVDDLRGGDGVDLFHKSDAVEEKGDRSDDERDKHVFGA